MPHAHVSVTRHHAIVLAGLSALMATAASPRADRPLQRTALKVAGATWLAAGLLNVYETTDSQMVGVYATAQCWHAPRGGCLCWAKALNVCQLDLTSMCSAECLPTHCTVALSPLLQTKATWGIAAVNCLLGGLCLWKATRASKGSARP